MPNKFCPCRFGYLKCSLLDVSILQARVFYLLKMSLVCFFHNVKLDFRSSFGTCELKRDGVEVFIF